MDKKRILPNIDEYISEFPPQIQFLMRQFRQTIHSVIPDLQEKISWGMPTFFKNKRPIHFAAHKNHIGFYPGVVPIEKFAQELSSYKTSKGGIQFPYSKPLPLELIAKITKFVFAES